MRRSACQQRARAARPNHRRWVGRPRSPSPARATTACVQRCVLSNCCVVDTQTTQTNCTTSSVGDACNREGTPGTCAAVGNTNPTASVRYCEATPQCATCGQCKTCDPLVGCQTNTGAGCTTGLANQDSGVCNADALCVTVRLHACFRHKVQSCHMPFVIYPQHYYAQGPCGGKAAGSFCQLPGGSAESGLCTLGAGSTLSCVRSCMSMCGCRCVHVMCM